MTIRIGTSGWFYPHWNEIFYPKDVSTPKRLKYYSENFDTVEINSTHYVTPTEKTVKNWFTQVPEDFLFSVKMHRFITHMKKLKNVEESLPLFFEKAALLKKKLGPILIQLPPMLHADIDRLKTFVKLLKKKYRYVFEFRHETWYVDEVYEILRKNEIALCVTDLKGKQSPEVFTADFTYIRLHGPTKAAYAGEYGPKLLKPWSKKLLEWQKKVDVYCYFDNDEKSFAVKDAKLLKKYLF